MEGIHVKVLARNDAVKHQSCRNPGKIDVAAVHVRATNPLEVLELSSQIPEMHPHETSFPGTTP